MAKNSIPYWLVLGGGVITFLVAVAAGLFSASAVLSGLTSISPLLDQIVRGMIGIYAVWGAIVGILLIWSADMIKKGGSGSRTGITVAFIFGALGLLTVEGFIIGPVLSLVGAAMSFGESRKKR